MMLTLLVSLSVLAATSEPTRVVVDPARPSAPGVFVSLSDAVLAAAVCPPDAPAFEITIAPGVIQVAESVHIGKLPVPLRIRADSRTARLVGGAVFHQAPRKLNPDDPTRGSLPAESIDHVRWVDLAGAWDKGGAWSGRTRIAGPVRHGMNLPAAAGSELFLDGNPLIRARWPNAGFATVEGVVDPGTSKDRSKPDESFRPGVFRFADRAHLERWAAALDVWLSGYWHWDWADDEMPAGKIDLEQGTIALGLPHTYGLSKGARFRVINLPEELDAAGEYWIDPAQARAYFWPPDGTVESPELVVSLLPEPMLSIDGAADVEISGLAFEGCRGMAIRASSSSNIRIVSCTFRNTGTGAIELDGRDCTIQSCTFEDIGACAVSITGGDRATLTHANNAVRDCTFARPARTHRTYQPAIRLDGVGQIIANNSISDLPHCAIIFAGNEHAIELNDISRVLQETGDSGAIYCGRDWTLHGTVIRHNLFHDIVGTDARYQNAVYLDDMASGISVESNIFIKCHWGSLIGGGRDIRFTGNVLSSCGKGLSFDSRGTGWMAKNIADPEKSTLHQRLRAVPIDIEPWKSRYPTLAVYLTDRFGRPTNGLVARNIFLATPLGRIDDKECVKLESNVELKETLSADLVAQLLDPARRRALTSLTPEKAPDGFAPIPVQRIGSR